MNEVVEGRRSAATAGGDWYELTMAGESARDRASRARAKAERLARYADHWEKGAAGESCTAAALATLGSEWTSWHDLKWPGRRLANVDHVVIGPGGIFVIDSKNWSGRLGVKESVLRQNGYNRETAVAGCADSALAVAELIPKYVAAVHPVMCFVREEPIAGWARDVMLCSTANVVEMLTTRPSVLRESEINEAVSVLRSRMRSMPASAGGVARKNRGQRQVVTAHVESAPAQARSSGGRRLPRFFVGLGIWFCLMIVVGATLSAVPQYTNSLMTPAAFAAGLVSWLCARRLIR